MPGFLLDLDGTLYHGDRPIEQAAEFMQWVRREGHPFLFLTNNSSRTPEEVAAHLRRTGLEAAACEVLTSSRAAAMYMRDAGILRGPVLCIGEAGLRLALSEAGWDPLPAEEAADLAPGAVRAVVQGIDHSFDYGKLHAAVRHIRAGAPFVLTNPDHLLPWNGELTPGAGSIAASIERASGTVPVVIGKPSPIIMGYAVARLGLPPADIWAVGDNLATDIRGGVDAGCRTALVLTGLVSEGSAERDIAASGVRPDAVCRHLGELVERFR